MCKDESTKFYPFDLIILAYSVVMIFALIFLGEGQIYDKGLLFYALVILISLGIVGFINYRKNWMHASWRFLYPALLFTFFYKITAGQIFLLHPAFLDAKVISFEHSLFGIDPSLYLDRFLPNVWVTEFLSLCYASYYLMIPIFLLVLFLKKKYKLIAQATTAMCLMFFSSYIIFSLFPVEGPRWVFANAYQHAIEGPIFRQIVMFAQSTSVHGGAMPSSHFGVALIIALYTLQQNKKLGFFLLALSFGVALGAIWGRYHYASDIVVGGVIGLAAYWIAQKLPTRNLPS